MTGWTINRRGGLADPGEPWHWCNSCPVDDQKWRFGGPLLLRDHVRRAHGRDEWPITQTVDSDLFVLDTDGRRAEAGGQPVRASTAVTGWIKARAKTGRLSRWGSR